MTAKLLVLAAIASAFVPTAPRATSLTKRFFFDQFIPNPEADAELDGYVGSAKAVLLGAYIKLSWRCGLMTDSRAGPAHGRRRRRRGRQDRARGREALHVHGGQPRLQAQQGQAARVAQAPRRRRRAGADRRGLCGNQPVSRVHPIILHQVISRWWRGSVERRGTGIATPSSRRRVDGVEVDATIQDERAVKF